MSEQSKKHAVYSKKLGKTLLIPISKDDAEKLAWGNNTWHNWNNWGNWSDWSNSTTWYQTAPRKSGKQTP